MERVKNLNSYRKINEGNTFANEYKDKNELIRILNNYLSDIGGGTIFFIKDKDIERNVEAINNDPEIMELVNMVENLYADWSNAQEEYKKNSKDLYNEISKKLKRL